MKGSMTLLAGVILLCLLASPGRAGDVSSPSSPAKPNVLFLVFDDLNDWVEGLAGHPQARTPNLVRLAGRGMLFRNAHCTYALCNPSRASVLTGLLPSSNGVFGNQQDWRKSRLVKGRQTLPEFFRKQGYWTGAAGKIYHANHGGPTGALGGGHGGRQGFHHPPSWTERYPSREVQIPDLVVRTGQNYNGLDIWHWDWGPIDHCDAATADGRCADWVIEQLKRPHTKPFFLALGIYAPHGPWYCPRPYFEQHPLKRIQLPIVKEDDLDDVPEVAKGHIRGRRPLHRLILEKNLYHEAVQAYLAQISFADATLGRVLDALEQSSHANNTIICLWSDHGWYLGEKQRWHKGGLWEEATRVPLVLATPGMKGGVCDRPVSLVDLYPTLTELCGLPAPGGLDGLSLVPLLKDPRSPWQRPALTISGGGEKASYSVRDERWRYTRYYNGAEELYDHEHDPQEWTNLADRPEYAGRKKEMSRWIPREFHSASRLVKEIKVSRGKDGWVGYELEDGDQLPGAFAPNLEGRAWRVKAHLEPAAADGMLLSQGSSYAGWAIYLIEGKLALTARQRGKIHTVRAPSPLKGACTISVAVDGEGNVVLEGNDKVLARGKLPGPIRGFSRRELSVGHPGSVLDNDIRVGSFRGTMKSCVLEVQP
jgi:arylsulfatase A-like enzyme